MGGADVNDRHHTFVARAEWPDDALCVRCHKPIEDAIHGKHPPMISYVVSVLDRIISLSACLGTLNAQTVEPQEIIVCCNGTDKATMMAGILTCIHHEAFFVATGLQGARCCYESANMAAAPHAKGHWLCFPSDDSLYVARFAEIMLATAEREKADLVYCDCVYAAGSEVNSWPAYTVLETQPKIGRIDKYCDGALIEQLVKDGVRHAKAPGILVLHQ